MVITQNEKDSFFNQGFFVRKKTISETTVESAKIAYTKMRKKCEKKIYNRYRIFNDIALNDIYGIEDIFHSEIFEKDIFLALIESNILEISQDLLGTKEVFLSLNRLHCTRNISHSGMWHRDHGSVFSKDKIDEVVKKHQDDLLHVQSSLVFFKENGFYVIPQSHKYNTDFIETKKILGKKIYLENEKQINVDPGDLIVFNPFIIHRGICAGHKKYQRAHIHLRFSKRKYAREILRKKDDFGHYLNKNIAEIATDNWKSVFKDDLPEPLKWSEPEIVHKNSGFKKLPHIIFNRLIYYLSFFYFGNFRKLEQWPIKYPYLKGKF